MSDQPTLPDPNAEPVELEPHPRVVRLNRRAIFVAGGLATAVVLAAVFTLSDRSQRVADRRESTGASAAADRFWENQPDGVPRLPVPPALPEPTPLAAEGSEVPVLDGTGSPQLLEPAADAADQTLRRAFASRPVVYEGRVEPRATAPRDERPEASRSNDSAGMLNAARDLVAAGQAEDDPTVSQNLQREKGEFLRNAKLGAHDEVLEHLVRPSITPYEVKAGSLVPAVLITQANSDLPGQLIAQVRENVFDTATGAHLLIPQGTRAIGVYDSLVAFGQERVLVAWQRLIFPNGSSLNLESMPGTDLAGAAGFHDRVQRDYVRIFGGAILLSAISAGLQISQGTFAAANQAADTRDLREILAAALGQNLGELGTEMARRNLNVQPTLEIRSGYRFNIAVMKDLILPDPYPAS